MTDIIERDGTEYLVIGALPDAAEALEPGDRVTLDGLTVEADGEGYKVLANSPAVVGMTDQEADTVEALVERQTGAAGDGKPPSKPKTLMDRVKGVFMKEDKAIGEGRGVGGPRQGAGGTDVCVCPNCGHEMEHDRGNPCAETKCPECGEPMRGKEEEEERKALADWADELGDEAYKALLSHLAETERMTEAEAGLLAADELEGLVGTWLEIEEGQKAGRRISGEKLNLLKEVKEGFDALMDKVKDIIGWGEYADRQETMPDDWAALMAGSKSGFKSFKGRDGKWRWIAWAASAFEDREHEFFKTKALEEYVSQANEKMDHGKLWFYHLPFNLGDADFTALSGRILLKMGTWAANDVAQKAAVYFSRNFGWGASVGYKYRPKDREDRAYDWLWVFETSPVPKEKAAFSYSRFNFLGGKVMDITEDQKAKLEEVFGKNWQEVLSMSESASKQLEEAGIAYKAMAGASDLAIMLSELRADEAIAEKAKANPVQMLKLALGKIKDEAAKGLVQKVIDALEKGGYEYPKPEKKAKGKGDEEEEEYGKPKKEKADEEEEDEEGKEPKKKGKKEVDPETLPVQIEIEGLPELVDAVKTLKEQVVQQAGEITGLKAMLDADDEERARQKLNKATKVVAYKASIAGLLDDEEKEGDQERQAAKMTAEHPLARLSVGTPLGPRSGG